MVAGNGWSRAFGTSEDCLYLNVWTTNLSSDGDRPVMVWIHGGGNVEGSSQIPPLAPHSLAKELSWSPSSIVWRIRFLGSSGPDRRIAASFFGKLRLTDQIAALEWVRHNIAAFGGDPNSVTIFGESSGAEMLPFIGIATRCGTLS